MSNTNNTGTILIEENGFTAESLRFESEPWTRFYMAGEVIQASRKASGKPSHYASERNTAHSDEMIDHCNHPRNAGSRPKDDSNGGISLVGPGVDVMEIQTSINSQTPVIEEGECKMVGCGPAAASSFLPTELVNGKTSRRHWPSRTRISSPSSAFPRALLSDAAKYRRIGARQH